MNRQARAFRMIHQVVPENKMTTRRHLLQCAGGLALLYAVVGRVGAAPRGSFAVTHSEAEWRTMLNPAQFSVLREEGTERPYSSPLNKEYRRGTFACAGCRTSLFSSDAKYDSHTGWPSFSAPLASAVGETTDTTFGMSRTGVHCATCGGHLGHVFKDGPQPTGLRYCMNGVALSFAPSGA